jgi:hypothetical protein
MTSFLRHLARTITVTEVCGLVNLAVGLVLSAVPLVCGSDAVAPLVAGGCLIVSGFVLLNLDR